MKKQESENRLPLACDVFCLRGRGPHQGREYELADLCVESAEFSGTSCIVESVLGKWEYNSTLLEADEDVLDTVSDPCSTVG